MAGVRRRWSRSAAVTAAVALLAIGCARAADGASTVRPAECAGSWYPRDPAELSQTVDELLARASPVTLAGRPVALICPHAGYRFSAPTSAAAYRCLRGQTYRRVIVLAFSHQHAHQYRGVDVPAELVAYSTPLGQVPVDREVCDALLKDAVFESHPGVDRGEHSLELQLPFLQTVLGDFQLVPLLIGQMADDDYTAAAIAIHPWLNDETLLVASSDFTHFGPRFGYEPFQEDLPIKLRELADQAAAPLLRCDYDGFADHLARTQDTICGRGPILLLLRALSMTGGAVGVRAAFDTSGQMTGDWSNSVTYQSIVFTRRPRTLDEPQRAELLHLARQTVTAFLNGQDVPAPEPETLPAALHQNGACFVTLENHGRLRGCIGNMIATGALYEAVIGNAVSACRDPRFVRDPVTAKELNELHIEISYLSPMQRVSKTDDIVVGQHGLLIRLGRQSGVLLPQVAYERGWTRDEFLAQTCRKAGLPLDAWKQPEAEIYYFEAEVFGEPEHN